MFTALSGLFKGGVDLIGTILTAGFSVAFATVQTIITGATNILSGLIGTIRDLITGTTKDWGDLVAAVSASLDPMRRSITDFWTWAKDYWRAGVNEIVTATQPAFANIVATVTSAASTMQASWSSALDSMVSRTRDAFAQINQIISTTAQQTQAPTQDAMTAVTGAFQGAFDTISNAATGFWNWLVGGSLWTDMLNKMETETNESLINILRGFGDLFKNIRSQAPIGAALSLLEGILPIQEIIAETSDLFTYGLGAQIVTGWESVLNLFANLTRDYLEMTLTIFREIFELIKIDVGVQGSLINQLWIQKLTEFITKTQENWVKTVLLTNNFWQAMLQSFNQGMRMLAEAINAGMQRIIQVFAAGFNNISAAAAAMASSVMASIAQAANAMAQLRAMQVAAMTAPSAAAEAFVHPQYAALVRGYQTEPGQYYQVERGGLARVHAGEIVGRPERAIDLHNVVNLQNVVQVDGATVARTVQRHLIQDRLTAGGG